MTLKEWIWTYKGLYPTQTNSAANADTDKMSLREVCRVQSESPRMLNAAIHTFWQTESGNCK